MTAIDDVRRTLDGEWRTSREIHERIGCWSLETVRTKLAELVEAGDIERQSGNTVQGGLKHTYRRVPT